MSKFNIALYCNDTIIPSSLISEAIMKLECGKSSGPDGVYAESIKFAHPRNKVFYFLYALFMFYTWMYACWYDGNYYSTNH